MPEYTFECDTCNKRWDEILKMDDSKKPTEEPHECGGSVHRVFNPVGIISDDLGFRGVWNPADGNTYDSRTEYHRALKENGCEIADSIPKPKDRPPKGLKEEIAQAYHQHS